MAADQAPQASQASQAHKGSCATGPESVSLGRSMACLFWAPPFVLAWPEGSFWERYTLGFPGCLFFSTPTRCLLGEPFMFYALKIFLLMFLVGLPAAHAQNLQKLYDLSVEDKKRLDQEEKDKKSKTENFYTEAKANGQYWKCDKNLFIFYRGYVVTGAKDDGSDMGKSPYDLIGNYQVVNNQFIHFSFPTLPYDNIFELNIAKGEAVVFKKSLNRLEKLNCTFIK